MPSQGLQQTQRLALQQTLSPQMQQSLQILQVPAMELRTLVQQEMMTNPVLEETPVDEITSKDEKSDPEEIENQAESGQNETDDKEFEALARLDQEWRDYFASTGPPRRRNSEEEEQRRAFLESISKSETLQEHLASQLQLLELGDALRAQCESIIGNLDERGYLIATPEELHSWNNGSAGAIDLALQIVQSFDPIGVGARDLRECLRLQLKRLGHSEDSLAWRIVSNHLDDLAQKRHAEIAQAQKVSLEEVHRAATLIGTLNPHPGSPFAANENRYITPDLLVQKVDEKWVMQINDDWLPHPRISNVYKDILGQSGQEQEVKRYVRERIRAGKFLIRSIHQRQHTILNIAEEILRVQIEFFEHGRGFLKPLTMLEVAKVVSVHETTVGRAIAGKYMQTPHGIFELKYFFTPGIRTADGQSISQEAIKQTIRDLVSHEAPDQPLSDQDIMQALLSRGIPIARRTVAKYREELKILPSHQRKAKPS